MKIEIIKGDITKLKVEAIVSPANSYITMGGGLAGIIRRAGGEGIKEEAKKYVPVNVGEAIVTKAGKLPAKFVIHAPTMEKPAQRISGENIRLTMRAILECAEKNNIREVAIPGLGTGVGGVPCKEAATIMLKALRDFKARTIRRVIIVAFDHNLYLAFKEAESN